MQAVAEPKKTPDPREAAAANADAQEYLPVLHRYLTKVLRDRENARDLAQETYLRFLLRPEIHVQRPAAYLFRIALNLLHEFRLRSDRTLTASDSELDEKYAASESALANTDPANQLSTQDQLLRVLAQIPPTYREVLLLYKRDGLSHAEIAHRLGLSKETVKKYVVRALAYGRHAKWE